MIIVVDNIDLYQTYGIMIVLSEGELNLLKLKTRQSHIWTDEHGEDTDLSTAYYQSREITLNCRLAGVTKVGFVNLLANFNKFITASGLRVLKYPNIARPYFVYAPEGATVKKETKWNDNLMIATFSIKLIEPFPVARYFWTNQSTLITVSLTITCTKQLTIWWGDGTFTKAIGTGTFTHTYTATRNPYYIQIGGDLTSITVLTATNATEIV